MATKPASGTALDTGHALYTSLEAVWGLLEGSGTSTADSKGTNTGTLSGSGLWSTDANGPIIHETSASDTRGVTVTQFAFNGSESFSLAFGGKQTSSDNNGMVAGDPNGVLNYIWWRGGNYLRMNAAGATTDFTSLTSFTTYADYVLTFEFINGVSNLWRLYKNGTITADGAISNTGSFQMNAVVGGFATLTLVGDLSYFYVWRARVLSGAEATTLASNPYVIFQAGAAAVIPPKALRLKQAVNRASTY